MFTFCSKEHKFFHLDFPNLSFIVISATKLLGFVNKFHIYLIRFF
jgi:hypothetical protein